MMTERELIKKVRDYLRKEEKTSANEYDLQGSEYFRGCFETAKECLDLIEEHIETCGRCRKIIEVVDEPTCDKYCSWKCEDEWMSGN